MSLRIVGGSQGLYMRSSISRYGIQNVRCFANTTAYKTSLVANQMFEVVRYRDPSKEIEISEQTYKAKALGKILDERESLTFEEFKMTKVWTFDEFKKEVGGIFDHEEELCGGYQSYCQSRYALYEAIKKGGNPALMI